MKENENLNDSKKENEKKSHYKLGIFYFNPEDKRPFPPKRYGTGWGVNWANPYAVALVIIIIIGAVVAPAIYQILKSK